MSELKPVGERNCIVKYDLVYTSNLGNFESIKIGVGLEQETQSAQREEVFEKVREWVEGKLEVAVQEVVEQLKGE